MGHVIGIDTTYTGNPVSFSTVSGGIMKSIIAPITYSQDLHGYANPWPGGGGKNLLPPPATNETRTYAGITIVAEKGVYKITGTATAEHI